MGATVSVDNCKLRGEKINSGCGALYPQYVRNSMKGTDCRLGFAFDGDADRLSVVMDGEIIDGDTVLYNISKTMDIKDGVVVGTILNNLALENKLAENGRRLVRTPVGDKYICDLMYRKGYNIGGEQSGHIILLDYATTGDGQLSGAMILSIMKRTGEKLSQLAKIMERLPQVLINVKVSREGKLSFYTDREIKAEIERVSEILGDRGRILVRVSGTEPLVRVMLEGENLEEIQNLAEEAAQVVRERLA